MAGVEPATFAVMAMLCQTELHPRDTSGRVVFSARKFHEHHGLLVEKFLCRGDYLGHITVSLRKEM
jgi:hypothetical protein